MWQKCLGKLSQILAHLTFWLEQVTIVIRYDVRRIEMNNKRYGCIITGIAVILVLAAFLKVTGISFGKEREIPEEYKDNIVTYENGDSIYFPGEEHLAYDEEEYLLYYDNELLVYTEADLSERRKQEIADSIDGVIVGEVSGYVNMLQIAFDEISFDEICEKITHLLEVDGGMYAVCDNPFMVEESDENPWGSYGNIMQQDRGNEENPKGDDWWAEAIGTYTAWRYGQDAVSVDVGIIDSGFDLEHEELAGRISMLEGHPENVEEKLHGTSVAGIIGAANNTVGLRGVHDGARMICADYTLDGRSNILADDDGYFTAAVFTEIVNQMAQQGVRVINLSFGYTPLTLGYYTFSEITQIIQGISYQDYLSFMRGTAKQSAWHCILLIDQLTKNGSDILFVESAGNGWNNGGDNGYEAEEYEGFFASVTEDLYYEPFYRASLIFSGNFDLIPYEEIKEHILVVGAVNNIRDENGNYQMTQYSNHGESVDICAPGGDKNIFTTTNSSSGSKYTSEFSGTSAAAPMVTGSAALLWGIKPELSAAEVKKLLIESATSEAYGYYFDTMRYPMLNIGNAAKEVYESIHPEEFTNTSILSEYLEYLVGYFGVIKTGEEEFFSQSGGFEHVIPRSRISGLLAAEMDDYDGDEKDELFVVRVEPEKNYQVGNAQETLTHYITLEVYDVKEEEVICNGNITFPVIGLPETEYQTSFHVFKTTDEDGVKIYFDHFFNFNSQTFSTIQLEYDGNALALLFTDGAEMDEYAYGVGCYQAISGEACDTILGRQSFGSAQDGWEKVVSASWEEYFDDEEMEAKVTYTLEEYNRLLQKMGLTETATRSMYASTNGSIRTSLQDMYSRCCLKPAEHYTYESGTLDSICSLMTPYGQGSVTLIVEDQTDLLYPYRTGNGGSGNVSEQSAESESSRHTDENHTYTETAAGGNGYDSSGDVFYAFTDILMNGSPSDIVSLYSDRQLSYEAESRGREITSFKELLIDSWQASWETMWDNTLWQYELKENVGLGIDEIYEKFGNNDATPDEAVKMKIVGQSVEDKTFYIHAVCYENRWYLSVINN